MSDSEMKTAMFTIAIFSLGAVALILYQHAAHTGQVLQALGGSGNQGASSSAPQGSASPLAVAPASLAGTPSLGQSNLAGPGPAPSPLTILPNWQILGNA